MPGAAIMNIRINVPNRQWRSPLFLVPVFSAIVETGLMSYPGNVGQYFLVGICFFALLLIFAYSRVLSAHLDIQSNAFLKKFWNFEFVPIQSIELQIAQDRVAMKPSVADGFKRLNAQLVPAFSDSDKAEKNFSAIERCLKSDFSMSYMVTFGSTGHGTNVAGYSGVDCFAVIRKLRLHEALSDSLSEIRQSLRKRFPDAAIVEGRPFISIPFGDSMCERHHVVPAFPTGSRDGHDVFGIPGPGGRWVDSCPGAHSAWINSLNDELGKNLKPFIRIVKSWNYSNDQPLWSFYLELCVSDFLKNDGSILYSFDMKNFFDYMVARNLAPFENAKGCAEPLYGTSIADKGAALAKLKTAVAQAGNARDCEARGEVADAYYWWRKLFNLNFPAY